MEASSLHPTVNGEAYLRRMAAVRDKGELLPPGFSPTAPVLDYGCAAGSLATLFSPGQYVGFDLSPAMVERAREAHPEYLFTSELPAGPFALVLLSSLLHEVYSYSAYSREAVVTFLRGLKPLVAPGGSLAIRDGVAPSRGEEERAYTLRKPADAEAFLARLLRVAPEREDLRALTLRGEVLRGPWAAVVSFLNCYTWGWASLEREAHEVVNFASREEWCALLRQAEYTVTEERVVTQEDYFLHLEELVALEGERWPTKVFLRATPLP